MSKPVFSVFGDSGEVFFVGELAETVVRDVVDYFISLVGIGFLAVGVLYRQSERLVWRPWNPEECPCGGRYSTELWRRFPVSRWGILRARSLGGGVWVDSRIRLRG